MFTIIISEKGGAERRETFDKNEINVGRVQGNDLMLPKGNVSKHHARLLFRDGRFIVTDLKSTNGTYVNGRKIAQATIVREGDKIYIGDFVLRLDASGGASQPAAEQSPYADEGSTGRTPPRLAPPAPPPIQAGGGHAPQAGGGGGAMAQARANESAQQYALERDPDESQQAAPPQMMQQAAPQPMPKVPPAPRVPNVQAPNAGQDGRRPGNNTAVLPNRQSPQAQPPQAQPPQANQPSVAPPPPAARPSIAPRQLPRETPQQAARRLALITLVDRVADVVNLAPLKQSPTVEESLSSTIDRAVREQAKAMRDEGEAPEGIDLELLVRDALRELVGLGPVGPLLEDDAVSEIHALRHDYVLAVRDTQIALADASFTSEEALQRTIARLAHQSGPDWSEGQAVVERKLARGATMIAIAPPAATAPVLVIRKRRRVESSIEELVRSGAISRPMATLLEQCMSARANVLIAGSGASSVASLLSALASAGPAGDRVAVLQDAEELAVSQAHVVSLALPDHKQRGDEAVRAAAKLHPDRIVVGNLTGAVAAATLDVIAEGAEGLLAGVWAPSLRQALARVVAQLTAAQPGLSLEAARESVAESFDLAIEVARLPDGRLRVLRVAELSGGEGKAVGVKDLFTLSAEGAAGGDGAFVASGVVPRIVNEFAARGVRVDPSLFKRTVGRS